MIEREVSRRGEATTASAFNVIGFDTVRMASWTTTCCTVGRAQLEQKRSANTSSTAERMG